MKFCRNTFCASATMFAMFASGLFAQNTQNAKVKQNIGFSVEIPVLRFLGIFNEERGDTVQVHSPFNDWGAKVNDAVMQVDKHDPDLYHTDEKIDLGESREISYRYYIGRNSNGVFSKLFYETPLTTGGVDRLFNAGASSEVETQKVYFNDLPLVGIISADHKITATIFVNMAPAVANGFDAATDSVYLYLADGWWGATQGERSVGVQPDLAFTNTVGLDYKLEFEIQGPTYYGLMYRIAFGPSSDEITMIEGGDLNNAPSRVRYVLRLPGGEYPDTFRFVQDVFDPEGPLPIEPPPINPYPPANKAPRIQKQLRNHIMRVGGEKSVDVEDAEAFTDPNGDDLTYAATSDNRAAVEVEMKGKELNIDALKVGRAIITLSAEDELGETVAMTFFVTVVGQNSSPTVASAIADMELTVEAGVRDRALGGVFTDLDGDALDFRASSSDTSIASAVVEASVLYITPKRMGSATIFVTADDNRGGEATDEFNVTVTTGNLPPKNVTEMPSIVIAVGDEPFSRDFTATPVIFEDPNGDLLTYSASSSDEQIAQAGFSEAVLRIFPIGKGVAQVTVTAEDESGEQSSLVFNVDIEAVRGNNPPQISQIIEDQLIKTGGNAYTKNLDEPPVVFDDPDEDDLTYTAQSSNHAVAKVNLYGSTLTVASGEIGTAMITVRADDGKNGLREFDFRVTVAPNEPPKIEHEAIFESNAGERITVDAKLIDDTGISDGILHYRRGGDMNYTLLAMINEDNWQATIPAGEVTSRGLEYFIRATDQNATTAQTDTFAVRVRVAGNGVFSENPQPAGSEQTGYRLFSVPLDLDNKQPAAMLEDDLGKYNIKKWRFFELAPNQNYVEYDSVAAIQAGKAYWLIVRESGKTVRSGSGMSQLLRELFPIPVSPGWNFIGNPFNFSLSRNNFQLGDGTIPQLRHFEEFWRDGSETIAIEPFQGYAFFHNSFSGDTIWVNPQPADELTLEKPAVPADADWEIRILARCQNARDEDNVAGVRADAFYDWDAFDQPEPPVIGEYVSVRFPRPEWEMRATNYATDFRPMVALGEIWEFQVKSNIQGKVDLRFSGLEPVPEKYEIFVLDEDVDVLYDLRNSPEFSFNALKNERPKNFKLMVGEPGFFEETLDPESFLPQDFELSQNFPNPFNPSTTIRFGVPKTAKVHLVIYNTLGEQVLTLIDRQEYEPGYHTIVWDGRDKAGRPLASGVYFYRLNSADAVFTKKMILVK